MTPIEIKCGACGAAQHIASRGELFAFEASHDDQHGEGVVYQMSGLPDDLPD